VVTQNKKINQEVRYVKKKKRTTVLVTKIQSRKSVAQSSKVDVLDCIVVTLEVVQFEISALKAEAV